MNAMTYTGIRIDFRDGDGKQKDGEEEKITYGIKNIKLTTNIYRLTLEDCDEEKDVNKWELFDITWFDIWTKK